MTAALAPSAIRQFATREEWLVAAVDTLRPMFRELADVDLPAVRVSVGWPGGRGKKGGVVGQCWATGAATDKTSQLFVSPVLDDAARVLDVVAHELVHAALDCQGGHGSPFAKIAKAIGLEGPMRATVAGEALKARLEEIVTVLGAYPHAALSTAAEGADGPRKQGTRMFKVECPMSGYKARTTRQWLDEYGAPFCPCHNERMLETA